MERRKALAFAAAVTCVLGSTTVAFAAVGGGSLLGFGGAHDAGIGSVSQAQLSADSTASIVRRTKNVYDKVVVDSRVKASTRSVGLAAAATPPSASPADAPPPVPVVSRGSAARHRHEASNVPTESRRTGTRKPTTTTEPTRETETEPTSPPTSTANPPVTTTTRPRGVPADWPPDKPIPPMPPNCRQPQLEDNGVWNCQDD